MTTQKTDETKQLIVDGRQATKKPFVEPEVSGPIDVLEATAFFVTVTTTVDSDTGVTP